MPGSMQGLEEFEVEQISRRYCVLRRESLQIRRKNRGLFGLKALMRIPFIYRRDSKFYQRYLAPPGEDIQRINEIRTLLVDLHSRPIFMGKNKDNPRVQRLQNRIINFRIGLDMYKAEV